MPPHEKGIVCLLYQHGREEYVSCASFEFDRKFVCAALQMHSPKVTEPTNPLLHLVDIKYFKEFNPAEVTCSRFGRKTSKCSFVTLSCYTLSFLHKNVATLVCVILLEVRVILCSSRCYSVRS